MKTGFRQTLYFLDTRGGYGLRSLRKMTLEEFLGIYEATELKYYKDEYYKYKAKVAEFTLVGFTGHHLAELVAKQCGNHYKVFGSKEDLNKYIADLTRELASL